MPIRIIVTGGTFDKEYNMIDGSLHFKETHLPEILKLGRCTVDYSLRTVMMVDSLEMTDDDRELIANSASKCKQNKIIITHGTDTMTETAHFLANKNINKTIVLLGAMIPYKFGASDALFNLGSAIAYVQTLPPGVYITMNGKFHKWNEVMKNKKTGFFEAVL